MSKPKERPVIFSAEMVRAILDLRKSQTRRVVRPQPRWRPDLFNIDDTWEYKSEFFDIQALLVQAAEDCPYGQPGDRLWVRESWRIGAWREDGRMAIDYKASPELTNTPWQTPGMDTYKRYSNQAIKHLDKIDWPVVDNRYEWEVGKAPLPWRSSRFMPRWASRIDLEVTGVRVEQLKKITAADVLAEGFFALEHHFIPTWDTINAKRGHSWDTNPWVWVVEFKVVKP